MFAAVVINSNARELNRVFDYIVPAEMQGTICVGDRVFVPFGKGTNLSEGYVSELKEESEFANKEIAKIEDSILSKENIELAKLMSEKYFCNFSLFQSLPDSWAIDQIFPIIPIARLNEQPTKSATIQDITCDSDGKINNFISIP